MATLNALDGAVTNNLAIVPTDNGSITVFPSNPTQLVMQSLYLVGKENNHRAACADDFCGGRLKFTAQGL